MIVFTVWYWISLILFIFTVARARTRVVCVCVCVKNALIQRHVHYFQKLTEPLHESKTHLKFCEISVFQILVSEDSIIWGTQCRVVECMVPEVFKETSPKGQAAHGV